MDRGSFFNNLSTSETMKLSEVRNKVSLLVDLLPVLP